MKSATAPAAGTKPAHGAADGAIPGIPPETLSGIPVKPLYTETDLPGDVEKRLTPPGEFPYLRGLHPGMYRTRLWTMRQFAGYGSAAHTNERFHYLLKHGGTGLSTAFDMPTLMGYDADHPMSLGEVGREGVAVSTLEDMEILFKGIPLDEVTTSMTINAPAIVLLAMYVAVGERHGIPAAKLGGTVQADMLKEYIAQKEWIIPPRPAVKLCVDMIEWCAANMPKWNSISISGYHIREAGATAAQELAFTLADGIGYVEECVKRGMDVDSFAPRLSFFWDVHNDFFEEIAKFRAGRKIWATVMRDRFHAKNARSLMLRTHAQTAGVSLTAQQPLNNVARVAIQALAAVLGGTQSLHTNSMDETLALPTEEAATVALRTQQIIAYETGVTNTPDPLAGSYFVEALTARIEEEALAYIRRIDEMGGIIVAVEKGYPQKEIADSAYQFQQQVERGERVIVGVNKFQAENEEITIPVLKIDPAIERGQIERVRAVRARRAKAPYEQSMAALRDACMSTKNLMPYVLDAVRAEATLGEICDVFREAYGVYREPAVF
ncbi:MAG TPA: methylmalonyl-CoA mutase family protein [Candidatus Eisenbacteria bacterium]|nr:methylmalonyl-CoA mutase family protein [Candidatus Eisenbacteria bacterium]